MKRSTIIPIILVIYLGIMAYIGHNGYKSGETSPLMYFGCIAITLGVIILLHFNLKKKETLKRRREAEAEAKKRKSLETNDKAPKP